LPSSPHTLSLCRSLNACVWQCPRTRFLRNRGRIVPYREVVNRPALVGELRIEECHDEEPHRYLRIAMLHRGMCVIKIRQDN
jgi:hypothetical protein